MTGWDLGQFLVDRQLITGAQLLKAQMVQRQVQSPSLLRVLVDLGWITKPRALQAQTAFRELASVDLTDLSIDLAALNVVPAWIAKRHMVLPLQRQGPALVVATAHPGDILAEDDIRLASGLAVLWVVAEPELIQMRLAVHYGSL